ncbi:alpha/beta fold hydrolase [Pseudonocardia sp.]|uniref:alpha/beta fold hydrolase n=1 Tax=Pseudonocardia sp. TaxID=60912 RepID=UPI003D0D2EBA
MSGGFGRRVAALVVAALALLPAGQAAPGPDAARAVSSAPAPPPAPAAGAYRTVACSELDVVVPDLPAQVECGRLTVPEHRGAPGTRAITLGVLVARATGPQRQPDPLFYAQGGPGGATISTFLADPGLLARVPLAQGRDVVLFDQRGTGTSQPTLFCPELDQLTLRTVEQDIPDEEATRQAVEATAACRARLVAEGVDLTGYTTAENAADVDALRQALGYDQVNLYGVSYGSELVLEVLRRFPGSVRSAVLDGVVPPQVNFVETVGPSLDGALSALDAACAADPPCAAAYPDLGATLAAEMARLDATPARVPLTDPDSGITYLAPMRGEDLLGVVFQALYPASLVRALPLLLGAVQRDDYTALGEVASLFLFDRSTAQGMYLSVLCAEDGDLDPDAAPTAGLRPEVAAFGREGVTNQAAGCAAWDVPAARGADDPVTSDVPTLLLSGRFDPITPAGNAALAAGTLERSRSYTFPTTGHGAFGSDPCAEEIVASFLEDPAGQPRDACLEALGGPDFYTADDVVELPALPKVLAASGTTLVQVGVFAGALLVLLSAWFLLPLAWLLGQLRGERRPGPRAWLARAVPWLVLADGLVIVTFAVALGVAVYSAFGTDEALLLLGLPSGWAWVLVLPVVAMVLGVLVALGVILGLRGGWRLWRRIYLGLLGVAALSCSVLLGVWALA